jgi:hypothetical protein
VGFICVFSHGAMMKRSNRSLTKDEILALLSLFALQVPRPKAYKNTTTNSFEIVVNISM